MHADDVIDHVINVNALTTPNVVASSSSTPQFRKINALEVPGAVDASTAGAPLSRKCSSAPTDLAALGAGGSQNNTASTQQPSMSERYPTIVQAILGDGGGGLGSDNRQPEINPHSTLSVSPQLPFPRIIKALGGIPSVRESGNTISPKEANEGVLDPARVRSKSRPDKLSHQSGRGDGGGGDGGAGRKLTDAEGNPRRKTIGGNNNNNKKVDGGVLTTRRVKELFGKNPSPTSPRLSSPSLPVSSPPSSVKAQRSASIRGMATSPEIVVNHIISKFHAENPVVRKISRLLKNVRLCV